MPPLLPAKFVHAPCEHSTRGRTPEPPRSWRRQSLLYCCTTHGRRVMSKVQEEPCRQERKARALADTERAPAKLSPAQCAAEKAEPCAPVRAAKAGGSRAANRRSQLVYRKHEKKAQRFLRRDPVPRKQLNDCRAAAGSDILALSRLADAV